LIIGPEGGFHDDEINALQKHAEGVRLGPRILRTETAALAVLSILQSYFGDF
jgi:16S rRNA (uracil1498-N3)-methyltransferase